MWTELLVKIVGVLTGKAFDTAKDAIKKWRPLGPLLPSELALPPDTKVVPKGLRSFDEGDAGFFIHLVPGPYRDNGLPESIHFWKTRIEETDSDKTFRVGLIYGPSGCGKSSLVKAGLLPHLAENVTPVYVEKPAKARSNGCLRP